MLTRTPVSSPCVVVHTIHTARHVKVRYWHFSDVRPALSMSAIGGIVLQKSAAGVQYATIKSKTTAL